MEVKELIAILENLEQEKSIYVLVNTVEGSMYLATRDPVVEDLDSYYAIF